jgi:hypothetical protein
MEFKTIRAAQDYLAKRITEQAKLEGAPLAEVERKMLYFSEDGGLSPAMAAASEEFDRDFNQDEYEEKIGGLVHRLVARPEAAAEEEDWDNAALKLCDGDNYLTVLINAKPAPAAWSPGWEKLRPWLPTFNGRAKRDDRDSMRLFIVGAAVFLLLLACIAIAAILR